ncbi:MAG: cupin domain-containing protein [Chitinophagaceae bacterium]|nr:cupin domain-containing protein [Chitinophagaceae bacterium]
MKTINLLLLFFYAVLPGCKPTSKTPTNTQQGYFLQDTSKPNIIALNPGAIEELPYDAGSVKVLASSEDTKGSFSLFELKEMPGYKTAWHRHNHFDESFYVMEGVLTVKINDKVGTYPPGSYILIPRGTPHGQANFGTVPTRVLLTFRPSAYEQFFRDRIELFKTVKPGSAEFTDKFNELRRKHAKYVEILGTWDIEK